MWFNRLAVNLMVTDYIGRMMMMMIMTTAGLVSYMLSVGKFANVAATLTTTRHSVQHIPTTPQHTEIGTVSLPAR